MGSAVLSFPPQSVVATISLSILDDPVATPDETFAVRLLPSPGVAIAVERAEVTIIDDDGMHKQK